MPKVVGYGNVIHVLYLYNVQYTLLIFVACRAFLTLPKTAGRLLK